MNFARITLASTLLLGLATSSFACGSSKTCQELGGVVVNGKCEGKCDPSKCLTGNTCVGNRCELICKSDLDCVQGEQCNAVTADNKSMVMVCQYTQKAQNIGLACPLGNECDASSACPDGSPCGPDVKNAKCSGAQCRPLSCISSGVGDGNAYCANVDCTQDTDCVSGMYCTVRRLADKICGTQIGTKDPCVDPSTFKADGATFQQGPVSLLRNTCRKRPTCAPCMSDNDCSYLADAACITANGASYCAEACGMKGDCPSDHDCVGGYCVPKFMGGSCKGSGNFCEPCVTDLDCKAGGPTMACESPNGSEKACVDSSFSKTCTTSADCPVAPSGKHGYCLDENVGVQPSDAVYHHCYFPYNSALMRNQCW